MASLIPQFLKKGSHESSAVLADLRRLDKDRTAVRMEVENTLSRFNTVVAVRKTTVVVAKPQGLTEVIKKDAFVRFKFPGDGGKVIRMEIATPHFNLSNGNPVFLCRIPESYCDATQRASDRFNTSRFSNLRLEMMNPAGHYRVVDMSLSGCRVHLPGVAIESLFPKGRKIEDVRLVLGSKVSIDLDYVIPRSHFTQTVGMQYVVAADDKSPKYLTHLITSLEKAEREQHRAESSLD